MRKPYRPSTKFQKAFRNWLLSSGYQIKHNPLSVEFIKKKSDRLEMNYLGRMNKAMKRQYEIFLGQYLNKGKQFIDGLAAV